MGPAGLLSTAEPDEGPASSFHGSEAVADAGFGIECDVRFELRGEVEFIAARAKQIAKPQCEGSKFTHDVTPFRRTWVIPSAGRSWG